MTEKTKRGRPPTGRTLQVNFRVDAQTKAFLDQLMEEEADKDWGWSKAEVLEKALEYFSQCETPEDSQRNIDLTLQLFRGLSKENQGKVLSTIRKDYGWKFRHALKPIRKT